MTKTNEKKTCQVCGRAIKAGKGTIAHHGYQRPYQMHWQSASCEGAQYVPYEESCERLKEVTEWVATSLTGVEKAQADFLANPPATLTRDERRGSYAKSDMRTYQRPEGFDPKNYYGSIPCTYEHAFAVQESDYSMTIRGLKSALKTMRARIAAWKPAEGAAPATESPVAEPAPSEPEAPVAPYKRHDVVQIAFGPNARFGYLLVTGCHAYGTAEDPRWAVDGQKMVVHPYIPNHLLLTPVRVYMTPVFDLVPCEMPWVRQ